MSDFNPRAPYGARPYKSPAQGRHTLISIHAPHTGRDFTVLAIANLPGISIHAPHTGRDKCRRFPIIPILRFQSTRPIRGATASRCCVRHAPTDFNPRAPYGARLEYKTQRMQTVMEFQSTRPIRGATCGTEITSSANQKFQSTRPIRGATQEPDLGTVATTFQSTRPIRGATGGTGPPLQGERYFNPRAPYGARLKSFARSVQLGISIHAPHTGRDSKNA